MRLGSTTVLQYDAARYTLLSYYIVFHIAFPIVFQWIVRPILDEYLNIDIVTIFVGMTIGTLTKY